jgi:glycosyltransferase involved in cell wall biosynthesis
VSSTPIDATPRIIPQSFAARVPVVAFANAGFQELIEDGRTGFLVAQRTTEALASKVQAVLREGRLDGVAEAAWREWSARFSLGAYRRNIVSVLEREE